MEKAIAILLSTVLELITHGPTLGATIWVRCTITNDTAQTVVVVNPDVGKPPQEMKWPHSDQAYQIAVLNAYGLISLTLTDPKGRPVQQKDIAPWVTPTLGKRTLQPQERMMLEFDLNELFVIEAPGPHNLRLRFGDGTVLADAHTAIEIKLGPYRH